MNGEATDLYSPGFTLVRTQFADQHPELVVKFLKVYDHAVKWQKSHPEEAVTLYARLKNLDKKVVTQVLNNTEPPISPFLRRSSMPSSIPLIFNTKKGDPAEN